MFYINLLETVMLTPEGRKSMLKLAERMVLGYCNGVGVSTEHMWTMFCGEGATIVIESTTSRRLVVD